jgi:hypothetical protein
VPEPPQPEPPKATFEITVQQLDSSTAVFAVDESMQVWQLKKNVAAVFGIPSGRMVIMRPSSEECLKNKDTLGQSEIKARQVLICMTQPTDPQYFIDELEKIEEFVKDFNAKDANKVLKKLRGGIFTAGRGTP